MTLESNKVKLGTMAVVVLAVCGWVAADTAWKTNTSRDVGELKGAVSRIENNGDGWHKHYMQVWVDQVRAGNPQLQVVWPNVEDISRQ